MHYVSEGKLYVHIKITGDIFMAVGLIFNVRKRNLIFFWLPCACFLWETKPLRFYDTHEEQQADQDQILCSMQGR